MYIIQTHMHAHMHAHTCVIKPNQNSFFKGTHWVSHTHREDINERRGLVRRGKQPTWEAQEKMMGWIIPAC